MTKISRIKAEDIDLFRIPYGIDDNASDRFDRDTGVPEFCQRFFPKSNIQIQLEYLVTHPDTDDKDVRYRRAVYEFLTKPGTGLTEPGVLHEISRVIDKLGKLDYSGFKAFQVVPNWEDPKIVNVFSRIDKHIQTHTKRLARLLEGSNNQGINKLRKYFAQFVSEHDIQTRYQRPKEFIDSYMQMEGVLENELLFFREAKKFEEMMKEQCLPVCLPKNLRGKKGVFLDIKDFYPLFEEMPAEDYVMNDLCLTYENPVVVLTGRNYNGKSNFMKSIGLIVFMNRTGGPVPAREARILNPDRVVYFRGEIDERPEAIDLECEFPEFRQGQKYEVKKTSTFHSQLKKLRENLMDDLESCVRNTGSNPRYLVLLNEPTSGTDSETQIESLGEILRSLAQIYHVPTIVETHCTDLAYAIQADPKKYAGIQLLKFTEEHPFKAMPGIGKSEGRYLAEQMGLTFEQLRGRYDEAMRK